MNSICGSCWQDSIDINETTYNAHKGNAKTDVLIIGGGMAGLLCAFFLKRSGIDYMLVEGGNIGCGITKNTTAKITAQHGLIYHKLIKDMGKERAKQYLDANLRALEEYKLLCKNIDCDFEQKPSYVYTLKNRRAIEAEAKAVGRLGLGVEFCDKLNLPFATDGAIKFNTQAQFNPLKFIKHISKGLNIRENTFVEKIDGRVAYTRGGKISAKRIIIATHYPMINLAGLYFTKLYQHRSYVIALRNAPDLCGMYVDEAKNGMSFRNYDGMLLVGGGDHRSGKQGGNWNELRAFAQTYYPKADEAYSWATQDCMSLDSVPYIGVLSSLYAGIYVATGFNKWGMTSSMVAARVLTDMLMDKPTAYAEVFRPDRDMIKAQLAVNLFEATANLLTPETKRCTHMGCALKWNSIEHTWDCTCHGSRFTENGKVIDNPAKRDLRERI